MEYTKGEKMNEKQMIRFLAEFIAYNSWQKDNKDFITVKRNAKDYLEETEWEEGM